MGYHGWDDTSPVEGEYREGDDPDMRAMFYAMGPSFRSGYRQDWIKLVDEYQIIAAASGTVPRGHRGDWNRVKGMLVGN